MAEPTAFQPIEAFRICREEVKHEQVVLGNRTNAYITSQSFLVAGYAVSMGNLNPVWGATFRFAFPTVLCLAGLALSAQAYPGILGSSTIIRRWHDQQSELLTKYPKLREYYIEHRGDIQGTYRRSLWFAHTSPLTFGIMWACLGVVAVWMHSLG